VTEDRVRRIVDDAARHAAKDPTARRTTWIAAAVLALCLAGGGAYFALRLDELDDQADASATAAQQLADQVESLGATPVVQPPAAEAGPAGVGIASVDNAPCAIVVRLTDGRSTTRDGLCPRPGRDIEDTTADGCFVNVAYSDQTSSRIGPFCGAPGKEGPEGREGRKGDDGETPPCMSEPDQCRGTNGTDGADGADGRDGAPPRGWVTTRADGSEETCTRDAGSPDDAPTYSCETTSPPTLLPIGG
jgi:hypothetical protein